MKKKSLSLGSYTLKMSQQCHAFANQANGNSAQATKINTGMGTSLAVQRLRRHGSNVGDMGLIPGWGTKSPHPIWYKQNTINNRTARGERRGEKDMEKIGSSCPWHEHGTLFPYSSVGQESACSAGDPGSIPGLGPEKEIATHSNILAWRIPWMEEPGRLQSMGSQELDTS